MYKQIIAQLICPIMKSIQNKKDTSASRQKQHIFMYFSKDFPKVFLNINARIQKRNKSMRAKTVVIDLGHQ